MGERPPARTLTERVHPDTILLATTLVLVAIGTVMVFSASAPIASESYGQPDFFLRRQLMRAAAGLAGLLVAMRIDYTHLRRRPAQLGLLAAFVLLLMPLCEGLGVSGGVRRGAARWAQVGGLALQPAELARIALVLYFADTLSRKRDLLGNYRRGSLPRLLILGTMAFLVLNQPSLGGAAALIMVGFIILFLAEVPLRHLALTLLSAVPVLLWEACRADYRWKRICGFLHPGEDICGSGYQVWQSKVALASGGLTGLGLGHSRQRVLFLPDAHTDFILSIVGEELGFIGLVAIMVLFLVFLWRGVKIAAGASDDFGRLLAAGLTTSVAVNWIINVGVVCHLLPVTGLPLPFISFGGSSLFVHLVGVGLLLSVSRSRRLRRRRAYSSGVGYARA